MGLKAVPGGHSRKVPGKAGGLPIGELLRFFLAQRCNERRGIWMKGTRQPPADRPAMNESNQPPEEIRSDSGELPVASSDAKEIFGQALAVANPVERSAFVSKACAGRPDAEKLVRSLLEAHDDAGDFLGATHHEDGEACITEATGSVIGRYKLLQVIGEGGFGIVYMADQSEPIHRKGRPEDHQGRAWTPSKSWPASRPSGRPSP